MLHFKSHRVECITATTALYYKKCDEKGPGNKYEKSPGKSVKLPFKKFCG